MQDVRSDKNNFGLDIGKLQKMPLVWMFIPQNSVLDSKYQESAHVVASMKIR